MLDIKLYKAGQDQVLICLKNRRGGGEGASYKAGQDQVLICLQDRRRGGGEGASYKAIYKAGPRSSADLCNKIGRRPRKPA